MGTGISGASNSGRARASARVAGSLKPSRRLRCVIQTAPSTVARQIAPVRWAMISPARPRSARSWWTPKRWNSVPSIVSSTPGWPSAARILRTTLSALSDCQSIARTSWRISSRARPVAGPSSGGGTPPPAMSPIASTSASIAARRTSWRYRLLLPTSRVGKVRAAHTSPASTSPLASSTVTPHSRAPSSIAQSSDDGPRSPLGPGCTTRQRCFAQIDSGISVLRNGHTISCGRCAPTAASIAAAESTTATVTSWPSSVSAIQAR